MQITLNNIGKRYNRDWIFRHIDYQFIGGKKYAITGANGSGKSTLLQVIGSAVSHNEGKLQFTINNASLPEENIYKHISIIAPYLELIEEMTAKEFLDFHIQFKPLTQSSKEIIAIVGLEKATHKQIRYYSSGMKQRLKLAQAFFSNTHVLLIDEPTTNLDETGIALYHQLINDHTANKLVIISSNDKQEYSFCDEVLDVSRYKL
ncbi:ABC transporter ATP-binding protein [Ferruginibacter albus]|uniref:ABC transporter ATP-binding protein n=1 Tax=Ferruginibacter albus TaxID=2875540 RepID=UPI001CC78667|nr:ATP-binding cassette domain-containing protein [Ferruginibacter albus]UAY52403.1 ATP-binding cassette domain-containing protein [Ferruginibacter albus]